MRSSAREFGPRRSRQPHILLVTDEPGRGVEVRQALEAIGFDVEVTARDHVADQLSERALPALIVLETAGSATRCLHDFERLRRSCSVPIIALVSTGDESDLIGVLEAGADDYLPRTVSPAELDARIRVVLRRIARPGHTQPVRYGEVEVDLGRHEVTVSNRVIHLTPIEYDVLEQLVLDAGMVTSHQDLIARVWGQQHAEKRNYLRPIMTSLRKKLGADLIQTEPWVGYRLRVAPPRTRGAPGLTKT